MGRRFSLAFVVAVISYLISTATIAAPPWTVGVVGSADNSWSISSYGVAYFLVVESMSGLGCGPVNGFYIDLNKDFGRSAYATVLLAKTLGKQLSNISYTITTYGGNTICFVRLVEMAG